MDKEYEIGKKTQVSCKNFVRVYTRQPPKIIPRSLWNFWHREQVMEVCHDFIIDIIEDCDPKGRTGIFDCLFNVRDTPELVGIAWEAITKNPDKLIDRFREQQVRDDTLKVIKKRLPLKDMVLEYALGEPVQNSQHANA